MDNATLIVAALVVATIALFAFLIWQRIRRRRESELEIPAKPPGLLVSGLRRVWKSGLDTSTWESLEETLLAADVGVEPSRSIVDTVRAGSPGSFEAAKPLLASALGEQLMEIDRSIRASGEPSVILVVGVNGSGKTTTIAKLAHLLVSQGKSVVLAAADTFRAAAGEQLQTWARRVGVDVVLGQQGGDPASVAHDAISSARAKGAHIVIVDTAGRLHGKKNLMAELAKIHRVAAAEAPVDEVLLVLDATAGQNGLTQVEQFAQAVPLTGIVLAKLDGTARGGIVVAVENRLGVPVKLIGVGEDLDDLEQFDTDNFIIGLLED